jgi:hypothetical protein
VRKVAEEIRRVLKAGGEFYATFPSKKSWGWQQDWPQVDENTKLREEEGPEYMVPHFYADYDAVFEIFKDFEILSVQEEHRTVRGKVGYNVDEHGMGRSGWHWQVLGRKK